MKIAKFLFWGLVNNGIAYALFAGIFYLTGAYIAAAVVTWLFGVLISFITMSKFVFCNRDRSKVYAFYLFNVVLLIVNLAVLSIYERAGINLYFGGLVNVAVIALVSYHFLNRYLFKT